jgi:hypothetical protein
MVKRHWVHKFSRRVDHTGGQSAATYSLKGAVLMCVEWVKCPCCDGDGVIDDEPVIYGGEPMPTTCLFCYGSGRVEQSYLDWLKNGSKDDGIDIFEDN